MRRPALTSAFVVAALGALSASAQLNPTVKVLPNAQAPVPSECEEGLAPAEPRIVIAEAQPAVKKAAAPPSIDLRTKLRAVQTEAERDDRAEFKTALAEARSAVAAYPLGGERDTAADVLRVYDDLERLWDHSFSSPTGAFFDASTENGALTNMMRRYPDYAKFIAESTLKVGGEVIYPTRETRQFLTAEAAKRLARIGVRVPTRITEVPPPVTPPPRVVAPPPSAKAPPKAAPQRKPTTKSTKTVRRRPSTKIAEARVSPPKPRSAVPPPTPAPVTPPPTPTPPMTATTPPPVTETTAPAPPLRTATETTATKVAPETTKTTTAATPQTPPQSRGRMNLLFAIILIIVGVGILIVLLRASD